MRVFEKEVCGVFVRILKKKLMIIFFILSFLN